MRLDCKRYDVLTSPTSLQLRSSGEVDNIKIIAEISFYIYIDDISGYKHFVSLFKSYFRFFVFLGNCKSDRLIKMKNKFKAGF